MEKTININDYISRDKIKALLSELAVTAEAADRVMRNIDTMDFTNIAPHFAGLFSRAAPKEPQQAQEAIEALCSGEDGQPLDDGFRIMTALLIAALRTREIYSIMGIDPDIYIHTMGFFNRVLRENKAVYGRLCFDRGQWYRRQIMPNLFRLGTLEFEMYILEDGAQAGFPTEVNVPVLSVHIPGDAVLVREELDKSYQMAHAFFPKYFPDFKYRRIFCSTWLFSPELKSLLPPESKILVFQSDYEITKSFESDSFIFWVYMTKKKIEDYNELSEDTTLRRSIKKHLLDNGKINSASGYLKSDRLVFLQR